VFEMYVIKQFSLHGTFVTLSNWLRVQIGHLHKHPDFRVQRSPVCRADIAARGPLGSRERVKSELTETLF